MNEQDTKQQLSTADVAYGHNGKDEERKSSSTSQANATSASRTTSGDTPAQLLPESTTTSYQSRWTSIQADFVDKPKESVREADGLVAEVIQELARSFAGQKEQLEGKWSRGSDVSTEDLRQALQQYRSFFQRLLAA